MILSNAYRRNPYHKRLLYQATVSFKNERNGAFPGEIKERECTTLDLPYWSMALFRSPVCLLIFHYFFSGHVLFIIEMEYGSLLCLLFSLFSSVNAWLIYLIIRVL